jgi:hypothetical protein
MKPLLTLGDLEGLTQEQLQQHIIDSYHAKPEEVVGFTFLVAYESVGDYGCDSSSFFLVEKDGVIYENHGGHCSCYGFEDQWEPEATNADYLKSDKFGFSTGGYDGHSDDNKSVITTYITENL